MRIQHDRREATHSQKHWLCEREDSCRSIEEVEGRPIYPIIESKDDNAESGGVEQAKNEPGRNEHETTKGDGQLWRAGDPIQPIFHATLTDSFLTRRKTAMQMSGASVVQ